MADILDELKKIQEEMDNMFGNFFSRNLLPSRPGQAEKAAGKELSKYRVPVSDVYETENAVIAAVELPGVSKEDIDLNITDHFVEIRAQKKTEQEQRRKGYYKYESSSRQFYRRLPLPTAVKPEAANAEFRNGILRIEIEKDKQAERRKKIDIK